MLLLEPNQTRFDLRFQLLGTPVRVHPMFWLFGAFLGWWTVEIGLEYLAVWLVCLFISVLIHEMGHVWMGMAFGTRSQVVLYTFGGLAIGANAISNWWKRVMVSFAGPLAGFLLLAVVLVGVALASPRHFFAFLAMITGMFGITISLDPQMIAQLPHRNIPPLLTAAISYLVIFNFFFGLLNLLPIWPLDGGQITRDLLKRLIPGNGLKISLGISFLISGLLALHCVLGMNGRPLIPYLPVGGLFMAIFFGLFAVQSFQQLQQSNTFDPWDPWQGQGRPWDR